MCRAGSLVKDGTWNQEVREPVLDRPSAALLIWCALFTLWEAIQHYVRFCGHCFKWHVASHPVGESLLCPRMQVHYEGVAG
jgi:ABC-type nickel/cobalt efflux system permease component RcnA